MSKAIRVLIFGTTGTGKTSLCNALTGEQERVGHGAQGVTFKYYTYKPIEFYEGRSLIITDTVGLNEAAGGSKPSKDAVKALIQLLKDSKEGYNLLIQVFRLPRITQTEDNNYKFFVKTITDSKIPTILVATGCENIDPMSKWKDENEDTFRRMGLEYEDIICTCFASGGRFAAVFDELRNESRQAVFEAINAYATQEPVKLYSNVESFIAVFKKAWNWLADWFGAKNIKIKLNENLIYLLIQIGFTEEEAKALIDEKFL